MDGGSYLKLVIFGDEMLSYKASAGELLAERLGIDCDNRAENDTSNSRIHRNIVKYVISNPNTDNIFLIGWTSPYRLDAEYQNEYFTYRPNKHDYPFLRMNKLHLYDNYLFDKIVLNQKWASIIYGIQQLLDAHGIKYYMFNTQQNLEFSLYTEKTIKNFNKKLYFDPINPKNTMHEYLRELGFKNVSSHEANDEYAKFLSKNFRQQALVIKQ